MSRSGRRPHVVLAVENVSLARDHRLRKQATALADHGYRVTVICRRDNENAAPVGVRLLTYAAPTDASSASGYVREYGQSLALTAWLVARLWLTDRFDAIQVSGTPDIYFALTSPLRRLGCKVVFDQRDLSPELYELRYARRDAVYRLLRRFERSSYRGADHVLVVNESLQQVAHSRGDVPLDRITVVGNGPELRSLLATRSGNHRTTSARCVWVGMMGPQDQLLLAVDVVDRIVHRLGRRDCQFEFIGDGECRAAAVARAERLGVTDFVSFPGWLPQSEVFDRLFDADLAIEPNLEHIVTPVKAMEYMAFGLPFVAFDLVETRRIAADAALYAPAGDVDAFAESVVSLLDDPRQRRVLGDIGRRRVVETVAWDHQRDRYLHVFRSLIGDPPPVLHRAPDGSPLQGVTEGAA